MTLNKISKSVACPFFLQTQPASFYNLGRQPYRTEQGQGIVFLTCRTWGFLCGSINPQAFQARGGETSSLTTSLLLLTHHRQPSRGPVEASRLLSVSEASVCSVDMDEMSLMDDD